MRILLSSVGFITVLLVACSTDQSSTTSPKNEAVQAIETPSENQPEWSYTAIQNEDGTWGYQILNTNKLYINQPYIPAQQGNQGFSTEEKAILTANFVIFKLESGIMPPSITLKELDSLKVIN